MKGPKATAPRSRASSRRRPAPRKQSGELEKRTTYAKGLVEPELNLINDIAGYLPSKDVIMFIIIGGALFILFNQK